MFILEQKYISFLSSRLGRFQRGQNGNFHFRCPHCGDSAKRANKARGYLLLRKGTYFYYCHNCGVSEHFSKFLKFMDLGLFNEYTKEKLWADSSLSCQEDSSSFCEEETGIKSDYDNLEKAMADVIQVSVLPPFHVAKKYLRARQIPSAHADGLFYVDKFQEWTNTIIPDKFENLIYDHPRIIIPFYTADGKIYGYQGRSLDPNDHVRYISITVDRNKNLSYGLNKVDTNRRYYVFEGPFDAMFIDNAIACCGAGLDFAVRRLDMNPDNAILVFDNEQRNEGVIRKIETSIQQDYNICIWPDYIQEKDVNDMILAGYTASEINHIIDSNICFGLEARLKLKAWRKI